MKKNSNISRENIWEMFNDISSKYDLINRLSSLGIDKYWRKKLLKYIPKHSDNINLLDLATGTGDQLIEIIKNKKTSKFATALGLDMSSEMIRQGQKKIIDKPYAHRITLTTGNAMDLKLKHDSIDCITMSFGIRNLSNINTCLEECWRVLTPNGRLIILEFSMPRNRIIRSSYLTYLRHILPVFAGLISGHKNAYQYLNKTIETFPFGQALCEHITNAGFESVSFYPLTFGIVTLYVADKSTCTITH